MSAVLELFAEHPVLLLFLVVGLGAAVGHVTVKGVGLGAAAVGRELFRQGVDNALRLDRTAALGEVVAHDEGEIRETSARELPREVVAGIFPVDHTALDQNFQVSGVLLEECRGGLRDAAGLVEKNDRVRRDEVDRRVELRIEQVRPAVGGAQVCVDDGQVLASGYAGEAQLPEDDSETSYVPYPIIL